MMTFHEAAALVALHAIVGRIDEAKKKKALAECGGDPDEAVKTIARACAVGATAFADALVEQMKDPRP